MNNIDVTRPENAFVPSTFVMRRWEFLALTFEAFVVIAALGAFLSPLIKHDQPFQSIFGHAGLYFGMMAVVLPVYSIVARAYYGIEVPVWRHFAWGAVFSFAAAGASVAMRSLM